MTEGQKWTVYPLLLLTLGLMIKDKLAHDPSQLVVPRVVCNELIVANAEGKVQVLVGSARGSGAIELWGQHNRPLVVLGPDAQGGRGSIGTFDANGRPQLGLGQQGSTVALLLYDEQQHNVVALGRDGKGQGTIVTGPLPDIRIVPLPPGGIPEQQQRPLVPPGNKEPAAAPPPKAGAPAEQPQQEPAADAAAPRHLKDALPASEPVTNDADI